MESRQKSCTAFLIHSLPVALSLVLSITDKVMGFADYHPNPCVLICPFKTCRKS